MKTPVERYCFATNLPAVWNGEIAALRATLATANYRRFSRVVDPRMANLYLPNRKFIQQAPDLVGVTL
jgi:hypothetical protein